MWFHDIGRETLFIECGMRIAPLNDVRFYALFMGVYEAPQAHARKPRRSYPLDEQIQTL